MNNSSTNQIKTLFSQALSAVNSSRWDVAENTCKRILALHPEQLDATYLLGLIYQNVGHNKMAISCYEKLLLLSNCHTDALNNLGTIHEDTGDTEKALDYYKRAVHCNPSHFLANYNLGRTSRSRGDLQTAISALIKALESENESAPVLLELGLALKNRGDTTAALPYLLKAREISPGNPTINNILGNIYQLKGELKQAISCYQSAIQFKPDLAEAYNNLGSTYVAMGDVSSALQNYRKAIAIRPNWNGAASNVLLAENYISNNQQDLLSKHIEWGSSLKLPGQQGPKGINSKRGGKIRVGYVSPDLRAHSVAWFLMAILRNHDHKTFHITCFSDTGSPDTVTSEIRSLVDDWQNIFGLSDDEVCRRIKKSDVDILVDLAGHTANNRLAVFAMQAAPVQATYLGYPNTTGLETVQYRITDGLADPAGDTDSLHTEKLIRLPRCFLCYTPGNDSPQCSPAPFESNNYITFGSFNVLAKMSDECIKTWSSILRQVPESKLILKSAGLEDPDTRTFISKRFGHYDVDPQRVEMIPRTESMRSHLQLYSRVDITLDTFPYNGTTTTCESLWMGAPVISLAGNRHAGRVGLSLLTQAGLGELVADNLEQYVTIACELAENTNKIHSYRKTLRDSITNSPFCDGKEFTRSLENAFKGMLE
jgi:protein O-GlcNAc transferase